MDNSISRNIKFEKFDCESIPANYNCPYCDFIADLWVTLREHFWNHREGLQNCRRSGFIIENYSCKKCDFTSYSSLVSIAHEKKCAFLVKHQNIIYGSKDSDRKTKRKHFCENIVYHDCSYCSFKTRHPYNLRLHNMRHHRDPKKIMWFQCDKCEYKAKIKRNLCKHIKGVHLPKSHKCTYCSFTTSYSDSLIRHITAHHTDPKEINWFKCDECEYKAKIRNNLIRHVNRKHASENSPHYECSQCLFKTTDGKSLKRHTIRWHTKAEDIEWFKCDKCEYKAKEKCDLKKHVNLRHLRENVPHYECSQCSFKTTFKQGLNRHVIRRHTRPKEIRCFKCDQCEYNTKRKGYLTRHIIKKHTPEDLLKDKCKPVAISESIKFENFDCESVLANYYCIYCDFTTDLWITLREHVCDHHRGFQNYRKSQFNMENYSCESCDFRSYSSLVFLGHKGKCSYIMKHKVSEEIISVSVFQCNECEFKAKSKHNLDAHIKKIHHKCSECPFTTTCTTSLKRHIIAHHTDPEEINWFSCSECEFKAKAKRNLNAHVSRIHLRVDHKCSECPFTTTCTSSLKRHITAHHTDPKEINWFLCDQCEFKAKVKHNLDVHIKQIHLREDHKCSYCPFTTTLPRNLKRHIIVRHTDPEEINWFKCDECKYKTKEKRNLTVHIKLKHARENSIHYECSHCTFRTPLKWSLKRHINLLHS